MPSGSLPWVTALPLGCAQFLEEEHAEEDNGLTKEEMESFEGGASPEEMFGICEGMRTHFVSDSRFTAYLHGMAKGEKEDVGPWEACIELGQCYEAEEDECEAVDEVTTSQSRKRRCAPRCRVCRWLLRTWPAFRGICAQGEVRQTSGRGLPEALVSSELAEDSANPESRPQGPASPPLSETRTASPRDFSALRKFCHQLAWAALDVSQGRAFVSDPRRYRLGSYEWNAPLACACLGQCPFDSIEGLGVSEACDSML